MLREELNKSGFSSAKQVFDAEQLKAIANTIAHSGTIGDDSHGIRCLLKELPALADQLLIGNLLSHINGIDPAYKCVKAIYFNKPEFSNWVVPWHQDLFINVKERAEVEGYRQWQKRGGYYSVQPPISILENIIAVRIHLDASTESNGTLKVVAGSHLGGVQDLNQDFDATHTLTYEAGDVMFMKPLLVHASAKAKVLQTGVSFISSSVQFHFQINWSGRNSSDTKVQPTRCNAD